MDNGLIFPYRLLRAHDEPSDAKRPNLTMSSDGVGGAREPNW